MVLERAEQGQEVRAETSYPLLPLAPPLGTKQRVSYPLRPFSASGHSVAAAGG